MKKSLLKIVKPFLLLLSIISFILIIIITIIFIKYCLVANITNVDDIDCENVQVTNSNIIIHSSLKASAWAFKNYKYEVKNNELHVKVYHVFYSWFIHGCDFDIEIKGEFDNINKIFFADKENELLIWNVAKQ